MDWIRSSLAHREPHREPDADDAAPTFRIRDAKNRAHDLQASSSSSADTSSSSSSSSSAMLLPASARAVPIHQYDRFSTDAAMLDDDDDDATLAQQLQVQREEMQFTRVAKAPLPRLPPPPSHPFASQSAQQRGFPHHAFSYSDAGSSPLLRPLNHAALQQVATPPLAPPVSPFAGLALSAPAKTSLATTPNAKPPVKNPFSAAPSIDNSPRLPSLDAFRAGSPRNLKLGIAARPPALSLRYSDSPHLGPTPLPSLLSSSVPSPHHHAASPYSQSLPGMSFLQGRLSRQQSFDGDDTITNASSDDDERDSALLMMRLSSSVPADAPGDAPRSGRVCRYAECNNIARSRGLCRTHGGGKRCSQPGCDKSAQANRKCIAHGGGTPCSFEDCEKTAQSRGLCKAHGGGARCKHPNCPKSSQSKGLCRGHGGGIKCKEDGCEKWVQKNGYCIKHGRERAMTQ